MTLKLNKPILVGGIALSFFLWFWDSFQDQLKIGGEWSLLGIIVLGSGFWFFYRPQTSVKVNFLSPLTRETVEKAIAGAEKMIAEVETEAAAKDISLLKQQLKQLPQAFERNTLQLAITGGRKVGKSSLKQVLNPVRIADNLQVVETEALFTESDKAEAVVLNSDLVLFITTGDLTESQWQLLQTYYHQHQRVILLFNKQDQYLPEDREIILEQLRQRVKNIIREEDIISLTTAPNPIKVRKYQADGNYQESREIQKENLGNLETRLKEIIKEDREQLIWGTIWREAQQIKQQGKNILNQVRKERALPIIEQYQWIAAAAAFANPVSALDLMATAAINAQMIVELSGIYQQKFSLSQGQTIAATLGKLMVQLGLVELSTQTIASALKSNAITYVAGGVVQGISAAYLTRLAGLSLIAYFQEQEVSLASGEGLNLERLKHKLQEVFQENQRAIILKQFIQQAVNSIQNPKLFPST